MKKALLIGLSFIGLIVFVIAIVAYQIYDAARTGNIHETAIKATYKDGRNILGQYTAKLAELAQVRTMSVEDQERIIQAVFGEGGRAGNQASWQWVQEQNPNADISVIKDIARIMDASRNKFQNHQTSLLERCRVYEEQLGAPIGQFWFRLAGYPNKRVEKDFTIAKMCMPIESGHSQRAFESGVDDGFQFESKK